MHIRPEAYIDKDESTIGSNKSTDFLGDVASMIGRDLSSNEKLMLNWNPEEDDIDTIERV